MGGGVLAAHQCQTLRQAGCVEPEEDDGREGGGQQRTECAHRTDGAVQQAEQAREVEVGQPRVDLLLADAQLRKA